MLQWTCMQLTWKCLKSQGKSLGFRYVADEKNSDRQTQIAPPKAFWSWCSRLKCSLQRSLFVSARKENKHGFTPSLFLLSIYAPNNHVTLIRLENRGSGWRQLGGNAKFPSKRRTLQVSNEFACVKEKWKKMTSLFWPYQLEFCRHCFGFCYCNIFIQVPYKLAALADRNYGKEV